MIDETEEGFFGSFGGDSEDATRLAVQIRMEGGPHGNRNVVSRSEVFDKMPYIAEFEPSEATRAKSTVATSCEVPAGVTLGFNLALLAYSSVWGLFQFLSSERARNGTAEGLILICSLDFVRVVVTLLITAGFLQAFWRRLVVQIAPVRPLGFQEAVAIVLMVSVLFGT